jgi:hypothetical protein
MKPFNQRSYFTARNMYVLILPKSCGLLRKLRSSFRLGPQHSPP